MPGSLARVRSGDVRAVTVDRRCSERGHRGRIRLMFIDRVTHTATRCEDHQQLARQASVTLNIQCVHGPLHASRIVHTLLRSALQRIHGSTRAGLLQARARAYLSVASTAQGPSTLHSSSLVRSRRCASRMRRRRPRSSADLVSLHPPLDSCARQVVCANSGRARSVLASG